LEPWNSDAVVYIVWLYMAVDDHLLSIMVYKREGDACFNLRTALG